ncbi:MAG: hypothetical protein P8R54_12905 [Myxococcota bacterium]|nr:hypothetical protein [Myxococcota bacterium]
MAGCADRVIDVGQRSPAGLVVVPIDAAIVGVEPVQQRGPALRQRSDLSLEPRRLLSVGPPAPAVLISKRGNLSLSRCDLRLQRLPLLHLLQDLDLKVIDNGSTLFQLPLGGEKVWRLSGINKLLRSISPQDVLLHPAVELSLFLLHRVETRGGLHDGLLCGIDGVSGGANVRDHSREGAARGLDLTVDVVEIPDDKQLFVHTPSQCRVPVIDSDRIRPDWFGFY